MPGMVSRPALPYVPATGMVNAAVLKNPVPLVTGQAGGIGTRGAGKAGTGGITCDGRGERSSGCCCEDSADGPTAKCVAYEALAVGIDGGLEVVIDAQIVALIESGEAALGSMF